MIDELSKFFSQIVVNFRDVVIKLVVMVTSMSKDDEETSKT